MQYELTVHLLSYCGGHTTLNSSISYFDGAKRVWPHFESPEASAERRNAPTNAHQLTTFVGIIHILLHEFLATAYTVLSFRYSLNVRAVLEGLGVAAPPLL